MKMCNKCFMKMILNPHLPIEEIECAKELIKDESTPTTSKGDGE